MSRKLARVVLVDAVETIPKADRIEVASIGGWRSVIPKGKFKAGDLAIYIEIDSFLPAGNPAWQFLVDAVPKEFNGVTGHILKPVTMRGAPSQGLLIDVDSVSPALRVLGMDVTEALWIVKFERPIPDEMKAVSLGSPPSFVRGTSLDRVQNIQEDIDRWASEDVLWDVSEKLEGNTCSFALLQGQFMVCSGGDQFIKTEAVPHWKFAVEHGVEDAMRSQGLVDMVIQGEIIGPTFEGNHYGLKAIDFYVFRIIEAQNGHIVDCDRMERLCADLGLKVSPLVARGIALPSTDASVLAALADGPSKLNLQLRREGLAYRSRCGRYSFKTVSDKYLRNEKLSPAEPVWSGPAALAASAS